MISSSADKKKTKTKNEHLKTVLFLRPTSYVKFVTVTEVNNGE